MTSFQARRRSSPKSFRLVDFNWPGGGSHTVGHSLGIMQQGAKLFATRDACENRRSMPHSRADGRRRLPTRLPAMPARCLTVMSSYNNSDQLLQGGTLINGTPARLWIVAMVETHRSERAEVRMAVCERGWMYSRVSLPRENSSPSYHDAVTIIAGANGRLAVCARSRGTILPNCLENCYKSTRIFSN